MAGVNRDLVEWDHGQYEGRRTAESFSELYLQSLILADSSGTQQ